MLLCFMTTFLLEMGQNTQNQNLFPGKDFYFLPTQAQKNHLLQLGIHGDPTKCDLHKIMGKIRYHYIFSNLTFENSLVNKKCLIVQVII